MMQEQSSSSQNRDSDPNTNSTNSSSSTSKSPWWMRWAQKSVCVFSGILCCLLGVVRLLTITGPCILAGILQILVGFTVVLLEAPCCCFYLEFIDSITKFSDARPPWQKALLYCLMPIIPIAACPSPTTVVGNAFIVVCGLSFAYLALGKKASRQQMLSVARTNEGSLVENAQPISLTDPPQPTKPSQIV